MTATAGIIAGYFDTRHKCVVSLEKFSVRCHTINEARYLQPADNQMIAVILRNQKSEGLFVVLVTFIKLVVVIVVKFLVLTDTITTLITMRDFLKHVPDISLQRSSVSVGINLHLLIPNPYS